MMLLMCDIYIYMWKYFCLWLIFYFKLVLSKGKAIYGMSISILHDYEFFWWIVPTVKNADLIKYFSQHQRIFTLPQ